MHDQADPAGSVFSCALWYAAALGGFTRRFGLERRRGFP
jgi:hypothetical protein